jgi:hypothetical protein
MRSGKACPGLVAALLIGAAIGTASPICAADNVVAVLSSDSGFYREAFEGFQQSFGDTVRASNLEQEGPKLTGREKLIITFGGKAEIEAFQDNAPSVSCLALGTPPDQGHPSAPHVRIEMAPAADVFIEHVRALQPNLQRLAVFWTSASMRAYLDRLRQAAAKRGIQIIPVDLPDSASLPDRLRSLKGNADAIFLPPDPTLVNNQNFTTMKDFASDNHIPFYVPTEGLVQLGGTASVAASFSQIGKAAAKVAKDLMAGKDVDDVVYPDSVDVTVNMGVSKSIGLRIPPSALQQVSKVYP